MTNDQRALKRQIEATRREAATAATEYHRLQMRWHDIAGRKVLNEERRQRFLKRVDDELAAAHHRLVMAEANLEGLMGAVE